jgi:hypothetical protein
MGNAAPQGDDAITRPSDAWTDLGLTLPMFLIYHLGVVFLSIRNAADPVTTELQKLADHSLVTYAALTVAIGVVFVGLVASIGRRNPLKPARFALIAVEGTLYATLMRFAGAYVVGSLRLGTGVAPTGVFPSVVMSLGAGFYEEIAFRVGLFGIGAWVLKRAMGDGPKRFVAIVVWAVVESAVFSGWHYFGSMGDKFELESFVFRMVCGLVLTTIFGFRGFAPAVWTHALYDLWAMLA